MKLIVAGGVRIEDLDDEAIVLDRADTVVHRLSGETAEALGLVRRGVDEADVPAHLGPAMGELLDSGIVKVPDWSRRRLLKVSGAGVVSAGIITLALPSPAAAASGTVTVPLVKSLNGNNQPDPPLDTLCTTGGVGNSGRGSCVFVRQENPARLSVTITLSTGTSAVGRDVYILQSDSNGCLDDSNVLPVGVWAADPALGPQTFSVPILTGATTFVVALQLSGGGGVDGWSSSPATLP